MKDWSFSSKGLRDTVSAAVSAADLPTEAKAFLTFLLTTIPADKTACSLDAHSYGGVGHWTLKTLF